ncbi:MAG: HAMP domain-containing histidine kinase [Bacteroidales bacterium]|nr:HAMP domain-containing histidine kinase [Bacteroidales bacterium]
MLLPKTKLKNQLAIINAISKVIIIGLAIFVIPWLVSKISIDETDDQLIQKLDQVYDLIETNGIDVFINEDNNNQGFGSYNILKEEYISIEKTNDTLLYEFIDNQKREIDSEIYDYRVISATFSVDNQTYLLEIGKSLTTIISIEQNMKRLAFYLLLFLLTISIFIDLSITRILLKPFEKIIAKLKNTQHPKHFDYSIIPTQSTDFNYLQESIGDLMHQIEQAFESEREFIGNVSHELLTPISILKIKLDNFTSNTELPVDEMLKIYEAKTTLSRLTKMVRALLLLSRIENREYMKNERIHLPIILSDIHNEFQDRAELKKQNLSFTNSIGEAHFTGNAELFRILISNLISNAIKYTPEKGRIELILKKQADKINISITDNGPGINEKDLGAIFDRFKKFGKQKESFGLGLALAKEIADYLHIELKVISAQHKGTSFELSIH